MARRERFLCPNGSITVSSLGDLCDGEVKRFYEESSAWATWPALPSAMYVASDSGLLDLEIVFRGRVEEVKPFRRDSSSEAALHGCRQPYEDSGAICEP